VIGWLYLALAILFEVAAATSLKLSHGIPGLDQGARVLPFILMLTFYVICFIFMSKSLQTIQLGVMYACWAGLGTILIAIVGVWLFKDTMPVMRIVGISLIICGVVLVNLGRTTPTDSTADSTDSAPA
jgi:small multidrug resistance pump